LLKGLIFLIKFIILLIIFLLFEHTNTLIRLRGPSKIDFPIRSDRESVDYEIDQH